MRDSEKFFLDLVKDGTLSIDSEGRVWRHYRLHPVISKISGHLRSDKIKLKEPMRAEDDSSRYLRLSTYRNRKPVRASVHRVVYIYFFGDTIDGLEVDHKDANKRNNHPSNLEPVTELENKRRCKEMGLGKVPHLRARGKSTGPTGEDHPRAKFTNAQAEEVRQLRGKMTQEEIAKMYGVSRSAIEGIMIGRTYKI